MKITIIWEKLKKHKSLLIFLLTPLISAILPLVIKTNVRIIITLDKNTNFHFKGFKMCFRCNYNGKAN